MEIHLFDHEPSVYLECFDSKVRLNNAAIGRRSKQILQESRIQLHDMLFRLTPVRSLRTDDLFDISPQATSSDHTNASASGLQEPSTESSGSTSHDLQQSKPGSLKGFKGLPELGRGNFGFVCEWVCPKSGQKLAVKVLSYRNPSEEGAAGKNKYMNREAIVSPQVAEHVSAGASFST